MIFHEQREHALRLLEQTGIGRNTYAPPLFRILWRWGVQVRPPHFMGFVVNTLLWGAWFSVSWGAFMWLAFWSRRHTDARVALATACGAGLFFGLAMASHFVRQARKHALPSWDSLG